MLAPKSAINATALVLASHGSSANVSINQPMFDLANQISAEFASVFVTPAFLDGSPNVKTIVEEIQQDQIIAIPFMASNGYYTDVVFKKSLVHPEKKVHVTPAIGTYPVLVDFVQNRIVNLVRGLESANSTVVVVGHGTRKNQNSCRTTIELVKRLRTRLTGLTIEFSFIDQNPSVGHVVSRITTENVIVIPFMMGLGPHVTQDIPDAFGISNFEDVVFQSEFKFPFQQNVDGRLGLVKNVIYDTPVGIYPELSNLCVSIARSHLESATKENQYHREVV